MGKNRQQKQQAMKNSRPAIKREKRREKDAFGKKTYTANDFLKDEFISCPHRPSLQEEGASDSDWAEFSDHGRDFLSGSRKQLRETAEEGACPKDGKKPEFTATPQVPSQEVVTETGDKRESAPCPPASEKAKAVAVGDEVTENLNRLLLERSTSQQMTDWIESNLGQRQKQSQQFARALMTSVAQAVISTNVHHVNVRELLQRSDVLSRYLSDGPKQLEALWALEDVLERMEHPPNVLRLLFDILFDEAVVDEDTFYTWKVDAERGGRAAVLQSVADFFTWLHR